MLVFEVVDGAADGLRLADELESFTIGRSSGNTFALTQDRFSSGDHAVVSRSASSGEWTLVDRGSTNGTWIEAERMTSPRALEPGATFVIGCSVFCCYSCADSARINSFLPDDALMREQIAGLMQRVGGALAQALGAAITMAICEGTHILTDRHLMLSLAILSPELPGVERGEGQLSLELLTMAARQEQLWTGALGWVAKVLTSFKSAEQVFFRDDVIWTPRLLRVLLEADERRQGRGHELINEVDVLDAMVNDRLSRVRRLYDRVRPDPQPLLRALGKGVEEVELDSPPVRAPGSASVPQAVAWTQIEVPVLSPEAHDVAAELYRVSSVYHLAEASSRQAALRESLRAEIARRDPEGRVSLLRQLRELFPITAVQTRELETIEALKSQLEQLRRAQDSAALSRDSRRSRAPWQVVLADDGQSRISELGQADQPGAALLTETLEFAKAIERFVVVMVLELTHSGTRTGKVQLPGYQMSIRTALARVIAGKRVETEELRGYLRALETWLVAAFAGYLRAPEMWFTEHWTKVSPSRIEAQVSSTFGSDAKCWARYKTLVRNLSTDLVADEIQVLVNRKAKEQFNTLIERRTG